MRRMFWNPLWTSIWNRASDSHAIQTEARPTPDRVTASLSAKVLLVNEMVAQKVRPAELARRLQITPQK